MTFAIGAIVGVVATVVLGPIVWGVICAVWPGELEQIEH